MSRVVVTRLLTAVPLLLVTSLLTFLLLYCAPGSFVDTIRMNPRIPETVVAEIVHRYGLDRPWYVQYLSWLTGVLRLDFGVSLAFERPVWSLLRASVPRTLVLAGTAQLTALVAGVALGLRSIRRLDGRWDRWSLKGALALASIHPIVIAFLAMTFAARSGALPVGGGSSLGASSLPAGARSVDYLVHLALPAFVLSLTMLPGFFLQSRGVLADAARAPFVRAGRARGLAEDRLRFAHVLPAGLVPLVSYTGSSIVRLLSDAFLVEVVTGWPGMGWLALIALQKRDPYLLLGTLIVAAIVLSGATLIADVVLARIDPRIRLEGATG
jgi:peptide/nickel transport system permease protein